MSARIDLIALSLLPLCRWRTVAEQLRSGQPALDILRAHCADGSLGRASPPAWTDSARTLERARQATVRAAAAGLRALLQGDESYPAPLLEIHDPPPVLWVAGHPGALSQVAVAIVGSRAGSPYALSVAERLAAGLCDRGIAVVSGLARGVDSAAHRGALSSGGITVAVLGCGADVAYPPEHAALAGEIISTGAVVSELLPGTMPRPGFFPRRNRIISGLVRAVVVIEAGDRSGSLITARCALEQGRDVLAVPGNVLSGRNRGGHALLRDGARLVETADDILEELGLEPRTAAAAPTEETATSDGVLAALAPGDVLDVEEIAVRCRSSVVALLPRLLDLELRGAVRREPGGRFVRLDRTC